MRLRHLWKLTWLEVKIFAREPLGLIGTLVIPTLVVIVTGRIVGRVPGASPRVGSFVGVDLPVFASVLIALNAVLSLVTIIAIYRENGILKRLRATPLRPETILTAHVLVKLALTATTLLLMVLAAGRAIALNVDLRVVGFTIALLFSTLSILSIGFLVASLVPTARFAQPLGGLVLYPMVFMSGLFFPVESMPPSMQMLSRVLPLTYAVSLLRGIWKGDAWSAHAGDVAALVVVGVVCAGLSAKVFRWE